MAKFQTIEELADVATLRKEHDVHLFDDIPTGIRIGFAVAWIALFCLFWVFFAWGKEAVFAVTISTLFACIYFGLPVIMSRQTRPRARFEPDVIQTCTGPVSTGAAATQMLLIPVALAIAIAGMGIVKLIVIDAF